MLNKQWEKIAIEMAVKDLQQKEKSVLNVLYTRSSQHPRELSLSYIRLVALSSNIMRHKFYSLELNNYIKWLVFSFYLFNLLTIFK